MSSDANANLSGVETLVRVLCLVCCAGAIWAGVFILPTLGGEMYGGAAVFVMFILMAQIATLGVVGLVVLVKKAGKAPVLSWQGKIMVGISVLMVLAEGIALALIPTSHTS